MPNAMISADWVLQRQSWFNLRAGGAIHTKRVTKWKDDFLGG
jgi:hypothetical protein